MFDFFKNLLRKPAERPVEGLPPTQAAPAAPPPPAFNGKGSGNGNGSRAGASGQRPGALLNGKGVELSLEGILANLPLDLQPRIKQGQVGDRTITVPMEKVLSQLSRGSVKISFGELRLAAPQVFSNEPDKDRVMVPLPLGEILARLNPALITRRRAQKQIAVPEHIVSPFASRGQGLALTQKEARSESVPAPAAAPVTTPGGTERIFVPRNGSGIAGNGHSGNGNSAINSGGGIPFPPARQNISHNPTPTPPPSTPASVRGSVSAPRPPLNFGAPATPAAPAPAPAPAPMRIPMPAAPAPAPAPIPMPAAAAPAPLPMPVAAAPAPVPPGPEVPPLVVPLVALAESWPDAVRKEIVQANLAETKVLLPGDAVERGLKQGRIAFSWKTIRSWIRPTPEASVSAHDGAVLELPLKVVAPLFLNRQRELSKPQQKVAVDHNIPNLFFGFPQPDSPPAAPVATPAPAPSQNPNPIPSPSRSQDTNFYSWEDRRSDSTRFLAPAAGKPEPSPGTKFVSKYATPNEVVSKATALDGVAGALIALPDGLMVASRLSADLNGDTLAAFLPQIFSKISQCTKELRMGELNNVNFTVGNVPWKIFRVNAIFFAAFGRTGEPLPTAQLAQLAAELDHKPK